MYYLIKKDKAIELREGKTISYIAKLTDYSRQYTNYIFNGMIKINAETIKNIIEPLSNESLKLNKMLNEKGLDYIINYFFEEDK